MNRRFLGGEHSRKKRNYLQMFDKVWDFCCWHCSVAQSCPTLCDPMGCSTPGFPILHHLPGLAQTHVCGVGDAIQPFHPLSSTSTAFNLCQHQGLFRWVSSSHQVAKGLGFQLPVNIQDWFPLGLTGWISLQSRELSRVFSITTIQKHQSFGAQLSLWSNSHIHTWLLEKTIALTGQTFAVKVMSLLFNMLSRLVIAFLSRGKCHLISWLQSPSAVTLEPPK